MGRRVFLAVALVLTVLLVVIFLLNQDEAQNERHSSPDKIRIAAYKGDSGALVFIAQHHGYFQKNGLEVTIDDYEAGKLAADALLRGQADISTSADFVFVSNSFDHAQLRILATIATARSNEVVARKDRGIGQPSDLKGKKVAVTRKSVGEFFLGTFLIFNGLSIRDVEIVDLPPSGIVDAVTNGEVDAGLTWGTNVFEMKKRLGSNAIGWPGQSGQDFYFLLITTNSFVHENPNALHRFVKSLVQAEEFIKADDSRCHSYLIRAFSYEPTYATSSCANHTFVVELPQALFSVMEDQARWRIQNKLTDKTQVPNYLDFIYPDALSQVNPSAVTMID